MVCINQLLQLAWSHDSKRFIVIGIGPNSSIVMYDIITSTNEGGPPTAKLQLAWQVKAGQTDPPQKTTSNSPEATKDDQYVNAFYMGEITSTGYVLAVKEQTDRATTMQLFDGEGRLLKMSSLPPVKSGGVRVETLYMSESYNGCYALGVQGGRVLIVRDDLTVTATINVVSVCVCECVCVGERVRGEWVCVVGGPLTIYSN